MLTCTVGGNLGELVDDDVGCVDFVGETRLNDPGLGEDLFVNWDERSAQFVLLLELEFVVGGGDLIIFLAPTALATGTAEPLTKGADDHVTIKHNRQEEIDRRGDGQEYQVVKHDIDRENGCDRGFTITEIRSVD